MPTTTNYGWTTPADTDLVKDGASAIRTLGTAIDTTTKNLNPSTTLGDIEYRSSTANTNTRLGIGSSGQVLTVAGGVPSWATPASPASGLNYVGGATFSSATSVSVNDVFSSTYDNYLIEWISTTTANVAGRLRLRVSGSDNTTSNYTTRYVFNAWTINNPATTTSFIFPEFGGDISNPENVAFMHIWSPYISEKTFGRSTGFNSSNGNFTLNEMFYQFNATTSFTGFTIEQTSGSGNLSGKVRVYGLANS
jgi:hypothetical protein